MPVIVFFDIYSETATDGKALPCGDAKASPEAAGFVRSGATLPPLRI
jgi:hypothetical protein